MADGMHLGLDVDARDYDLPPREKRFTVEEFERMGELGLLPEPGKHELWDGRIVLTPPPGTPHTDRQARIHEELVAGMIEAGLRGKFRVLSDGGLRIGASNLRGPDIMVARLPFDIDKRLTGENIVLVAEVAHSSVATDLRDKRGKYAGAGIQEYWVVEVAKGLLHPFRHPNAGDYPDCAPLKAGDRISPLFAPQITLNVADLV